jgi:hypothetical protein
MATQVPSKKEVALKFLEESVISIFLNPRAKESRVPEQFKKLPQLRLDVGLNMAVNIPDLNFDDEGFSCTLSFNRTPFWCSVPWKQVFAIMGDEDRAVVWPDDVPPEGQQGTRASKEDDAGREDSDGPAVAAVPQSAPAAERAAKAAPARARAQKTEKKNGLQAIQGGVSDGKKRELPPYLRVVK